ncbi:MAG: TetR/AcrR family transcriptional regulator [Chloroflexi bacterium]|nr:MAG: TetR/AcrR family transcriptional regulator [Chloroflexota bacterium]
MTAQPAAAEPIAPRETPAAHAAAVRERILEGAGRAFAASGFRANIPAIAAEAGVSVGLIYRYFESKEELFLAVCSQQTDAKLDELARTLAGIPDPRARLEAAIGIFVTSLQEERWGAIVVHAWAEADRNPRIRDLLQRMFDQQRGFSAMFVREAIARGEASPSLDVEALSLATGMLLHGAIAFQAERGPAFDPGPVAQAITTTLGAHLQQG